jgi:flagellar biosynthetic protein FliP
VSAGALLATALEPGMQLNVSGGGSAAVRLFLFLTALSFASALLLSITAFTRIVIVLAFVRQALGTPQLPPTQVLMGLALALTGFVMAPTAERVWTEALAPYSEEQLGYAEAYQRASVPVREFMLRQTRSADLALFYDISGTERPERADTVPMTIAVPAFMVSELTTAFRMGLFVFIPLLMMDLLVSAILMALGMQMVPPTLVALPLKVGVFLLADGWNLLVASLVRSFG